ncbi:mitogen-activated protein kinase [Xylariaceae sp. FL0255]|nr:mitogen-activated protein kinase [Xylariaceae sp. FL0255]
MPTLAPAPLPPNGSTAEPTPPQQANLMPFNCQPCVRRKVKCDRLKSGCSSCARRECPCFYQAPAPPRARKRRPLPREDVHERLARYERILKENGLLSSATVTSSEDTGTSAPGLGSGSPDQEDTKPPGKLLSTETGKARYIASNIWLNAADEEMQAIMDEDSDDPQHVRQRYDGIETLGKPTDPLSQALLGLTHNLTAYHPPAATALKLWKAYTENVEPLCRILHIPTTARMVEAVSKHPGHATKAQECLLFAIYYFAIHSLPASSVPQICGGEQSSVLLLRYKEALQQALVNASWLRTTEFPVIQAYVLYLIASRSTMDPHIYWILVGVALRLSQRIGLHRDGEALGLPPFEVQMRRRLFWQILPLDGYASQITGTGIHISPNSWDTKMPLNVNDADIWPGMTTSQFPKEVHGATDMIFALTKVELSNFYIRTAVRNPNLAPISNPGTSSILTYELSSQTQTKGPIPIQSGSGSKLTADSTLSRTIDAVEAAVESKYLRYCDVINPLHFVTLAITRSAINMVRLRSIMPSILNVSITSTARRTATTRALGILDTDKVLYQNPDMVKFRWHIQNFFLRDAMVVVLASLGRPGFFQEPEERDSVWEKVRHVYANHSEPLQKGRALYILVARVTLQAWRVNPPSDCVPEPEFISSLRALERKTAWKSQAAQAGGNRSSSSGDTSPTLNAAPVSDSTFDTDMDFSSGGFGGMLGSFDGQNFNSDMSINPLSMDWAFWDEFNNALNR